MIRSTFLALVVIPFFLHAQTGDTSGTQMFKNDPLTSLILPAALIGAGAGLNGSGEHSIKAQVLQYRDRQLPRFNYHADDYLRFAPVVLVYGLEWAGMKPRTDVINRSVILFKSELLMTAIIVVLKKTTQVAPPHSIPGITKRTSFPSGHTGVAFAAAAVLSTEYGYRYKWVPYVSYGIASSVGLMRLMNGSHYIGDVLAGAGIGLLSAKIAYWTHRYKWGRRLRIMNDE